MRRDPGARSTVPEMGVSSPASVRSSVVLPPPFGPTSATTSPLLPSSVTPSSTGVRDRAGRQPVDAPGDGPVGAACAVALAMVERCEATPLASPVER